MDCALIVGMGPYEDTDRLAAAALAAGDPTAWFDQLYRAAEGGGAVVPWDRPEPTPLLVDWARDAARSGGRALVVGCGLGRDAEFVAGLGFATTAFDVSPTAVRLARERHPGTRVDYRAADLLDPPPEWSQAYDLVVESNTVQSLPRVLRRRATSAVASFVAPGGTLLVMAAAVAEPGDEGPPWPLTRDDLDGFAAAGLGEVSVEEMPSTEGPFARRWRAVFTR